MKKGSRVRRIDESCFACAIKMSLLNVPTPGLGDEATIAGFADNGNAIFLEEYGDCEAFIGGKAPFHVKDFIEIEPPVEVVPEPTVETITA